MHSIRSLFYELVKLEQSLDMERLMWRSLNLWPLFRQCCWLEYASQANNKLTVSPPSSAQKDKCPLRFPVKLEVPQELKRNIKILFLSRPAYLVQTPNRELFDRVIDPLIYALNGEVQYQKMYLSPFKYETALSYPAPVLYTSQVKTESNTFVLPQEILLKVSLALGINSLALLNRFRNSFSTFVKWFETGNALYETFPTTRQVYLACWYIPDCMGITAALRLRGVHVVDVQHGKQGKFHPMYSGWTKATDSGYEMLPSRFWCWGTTSVENIIRSSSFGDSYRAFVGGLPWIDYYKKHFKWRAIEKPTSKRVVLLTMQAKVYLNPEPIPTFVLKFLRAAEHNLKFIFKIHPNDIGAQSYINERLNGIPVESYEIIDASVPVYDLFARSTHHLTAFSSTCYEANLFGIPTMLFGEAAKELYDDEITSKVFSWTDDIGSDFLGWLESSNVRKIKENSYIESSLSLAKSLMLKMG